MKWLVQRKHDTSAHAVTGSFDEAVRFARSYCQTIHELCSVFTLPRNVRVADVGCEGVRWKASDWFEDEKCVSHEHPEWRRMWDSLYALTGSYADENPRSGERWQYTGTYWKQQPAIGSLLPLNLLVHEFRHRDRAAGCAPIRGAVRSYGRIVLKLSASHEYSGNWNHPIPEGSLA